MFKYLRVPVLTLLVTANNEQQTAYLPFVISTKPTENGARRDLCLRVYVFTCSRVSVTCEQRTAYSEQRTTYSVQRKAFLPLRHKAHEEPLRIGFYFILQLRKHFTCSQ